MHEQVPGQVSMVVNGKLRLPKKVPHSTALTHIQSGTISGRLCDYICLSVSIPVSFTLG
jgi:hypothetical protein